MTTYTIYQYQSLGLSGLPLEPAAKRTAAQATGVSVQMDSDTQYVAVIPTANMNLRISQLSGQAATTDDFVLEAGKQYGFAVRAGSKPFLYGL